MCRVGCAGSAAPGGAGVCVSPAAVHLHHSAAAAAPRDSAVHRALTCQPGKPELRILVATYKPLDWGAVPMSYSSSAESNFPEVLQCKLHVVSRFTVASFWVHVQPGA